MPTKTISVDLEAYERLRRARSSARESFSQIIKRAVWTPEPGTAGQLLALTRAQGECLPAAALDALDRMQDEDVPAPDRWAGTNQHPIETDDSDRHDAAH